MAQPNSNARRKTIFDDWKQPQAATIDPVQGGKYPATWIIQQKSNGKIVMKINDGIYDPNSKSNHKEVEMNWSDRNALMEGILEACEDPNFETSQMVIRKKDFIKSGGQSKISDNPIVKGMFTIDRNKNTGVISVTYRKGEYDAKIVFRGAFDTVLYRKGADGQKYEDHGTLSRWAAKAWVKWHQDPVNQMEREMYEPPAPKENSFQQRDNNGGAGKGRNNSDSDFDSTYDDDDF